MTSAKFSLAVKWRPWLVEVVLVKELVILDDPVASCGTIAGCFLTTDCTAAGIRPIDKAGWGTAARGVTEHPRGLVCAIFISSINLQKVSVGSEACWNSPTAAAAGSYHLWTLKRLHPHRLLRRRQGHVNELGHASRANNNGYFCLMNLLNQATLCSRQDRINLQMTTVRSLFRIPTGPGIRWQHPGGTCLSLTIRPDRYVHIINIIDRAFPWGTTHIGILNCRLVMRTGGRRSEVSMRRQSQQLVNIHTFCTRFSVWPCRALRRERRQRARPRGRLNPCLEIPWHTIRTVKVHCFVACFDVNDSLMLAITTLVWHPWWAILSEFLNCVYYSPVPGWKPTLMVNLQKKSLLWVPFWRWFITYYPH